ncbi:hypothetical protein NE848_11620 [Gramella jeungdoensis]|uniref:Uncharacterized protein n=1 Tax=Gramella jeungdoensis TaxID=708091 RepID=A0ABT0Z2R6_9FLAO|nr:hypothetical protein [Gramella jeungdoensis]MCM8570031.1 hypothetical protein [Gramella jeungdoensis]
MSTKNLISLLLIPLFLGKLFIVDTGLVKIISQGSVSFVKPYCKKKQSTWDSKKTYDFNQSADEGRSVIEISSFCTPQFSFNVFSWDLNISEDISIENIIFTSRLSYLYLDSHSPPPRLV